MSMEPVHDERQRERRPPPSLRDWALLAINIVFVAGGLAILPSDRDTGIVTLAFFGSCLAVTVATLWRKHRYRRYSPGKVEVVGGTPIRPKVGVMLGLGVWMLALGTVLVIYGQHYPLAFRVLSGFVAVAGAVLLLLALSGQWPGGWLQFDPDVLTIAQRGFAVRLPWHDIVAVVEGDYETNPLLLIAVADVTALEVVPSEARAKALRTIGRTRGTMGADFAIMTTHYGIDLPVLADAVRRYAGDATARRELRPRLA